MHSSEQKKLTISATVERESVVVPSGTPVLVRTHPDDLFRPFHRTSGTKGLGLHVSRAIAHSFSGAAEVRAHASGLLFYRRVL
jgi:C4-dicarboxylate-specific signal transduction histidine kinase